MGIFHHVKKEREFSVTYQNSLSKERVDMKENKYAMNFAHINGNLALL